MISVRVEYLRILMFKIYKGHEKRWIIDQQELECHVFV